MSAVENAVVDVRSRLDRHLREEESSKPFRAREILARDEILSGNESAVIDLAYEEYCRRTANGEQIDRSEFAAEFPEVQQSLARLLALHTFLDHPSRDWTVRGRVEWPVVGERKSGFELVEELGRGAFSRVFLAREEALGGREVVVKFSSRGGDEAAALGQLEHEHIVNVYSARSDTNGMVAICMPFEGRRTLQDTAFPFSNSLDAVVRTCEKLAGALDHAHHHGYLHCDVKPSNVLLRDDGEPVLLDFNLARDTSRDQVVAGGTLPFMAPEQIEQVLGDREATIGPTADVYGLAATMYHVIIGGPPFPVDNTTTLQAALVSRKDRVPVLATLRSRVPVGLAQIIAGALEFESQCRPKSCSAFAEQLAVWRRRHARRHRWGLALAATTVAFVAVAAAMWWLPTGSTSVETVADGNSPDAATRLMVEAETEAETEDEATSGDEPEIDCLAEYERARTLQRKESWDNALETYLRLLDQGDELLSTAGVDSAMVLDAARVCWLARTMDAGDLETLGLLQSPGSDRTTDLGDLTTKYAAATKELRNPDRDVVQQAWLPLRSVVGREPRDPGKRMALAVLTLLMSRATLPLNEDHASRLRSEAELHSRVAIDLDRGVLD